MNLLLDTHVFLWWQDEDRRLTPESRSGIERAERVYVSVVSAWEAAIKASLGRLKLRQPFVQGVRESGFEALLVTFEHAAFYETLPLLHGDPFDRMLVAQALYEKLTLVTVDRRMKAYSVPRMDI